MSCKDENIYNLALYTKNLPAPTLDDTGKKA